MKINNTCAHLEFKWNGHDICFLDIGLRAGGGGLTHKLIEISSGRDLFGAWFRSIKQSTFNNQLNMVKKNFKSFLAHFNLEIKSKYFCLINFIHKSTQEVSI